MAPIALLMALWTGCVPVYSLESGSYVPLDEEETLGITGINVNAGDKLVLLVLDDSVHRWPMQAIPVADWPTGCAEQRKEPTPEMAWEGSADPLQLDGAEPTHFRVSAWCEAERHLRLTSNDISEWELILEPFDP